MGTILIVDDDPQLRQSFKKLLEGEGHEVTTASTGEAGLESVRERVPDLAITDIRLPGMDGLAAYKAMRELDPHLPVIIMTAYGTTDTAIEATKLGAFDYVLKPFDIPTILDLINQALKAGKFMQNRVRMDAHPLDAPVDALIGRSPAMQELYKAIGRVAPTDATVLLRGESGTGKELVARALYQHSTRAHRPFLIINCVAIPETLLEAELFGYEKGAFTGAVNRRVGKIERANHGSIFLDEIGDMPFEIQSKILRLLQEKSIERLGGREPIGVDVRIIAATNRNLEEAVADGKFREDLYYRLKVVTMWLPPLRERTEDIGLLTDYFLARWSREMHIENPGITKAAKATLKAYSWPGNVRELGNAMQKTLIFSRGCPLEPDDVVRAVEGAGTTPSPSEGAALDDEGTDQVITQWIHRKMIQNPDSPLFEDLTAHFAGLVLCEALNLTDGNRPRGAKLLGLSRPTLLSKIDKLGITTKTRAS